MELDRCMRWSPKIANALEINWPVMCDNFEEVQPILAMYKIARHKNKAACGRATLNRKLREWEFEMCTTGASWTAYIYRDATFCKGAAHGQMPFCRR